MEEIDTQICQKKKKTKQIYMKKTIPFWKNNFNFYFIYDIKDE